MPRRRAEPLVPHVPLVPLEREILRAGLRFAADGERFHAFGLARAMQDRRRGLIAHDVLEAALGRLQEAGMLTAAQEDARIAEEAGRPPRTLYEVTPEGAAALQAAERAAPDLRAALHPGGR